MNTTKPYSVHRRHVLIFFQTQEWVKNWQGARKPNIQTLSLFTGYSEESIIESIEFVRPSKSEGPSELYHNFRKAMRAWELVFIVEDYFDRQYEKEAPTYEVASFFSFYGISSPRLNINHTTISS